MEELCILIVVVVTRVIKLHRATHIHSQNCKAGEM